MKAETEPKNATYKLSLSNCFSLSSQKLIKVCSDCVRLSQLSLTQLQIFSPCSKLCASQNSPGWFLVLQCDKPAETASLDTN